METNNTFPIFNNLWASFFSMYSPITKKTKKSSIKKKTSDKLLDIDLNLPFPDNDNTVIDEEYLDETGLN